MKPTTYLLGMITAFALAANSAHAITYGFGAITANDVASAAAGESQLFMDVTDLGGGQAAFKFTNAGPAACSITDVYFDDGSVASLASLASITNGSGVSFSNGASPPNLPSGAPYSFTADFAMDSDSPAQPNGVNPSESLIIAFNLAGGVSFADLIDELDSAELRVGIHVQGFASGSSEAYINTTQVPAPGAIALAALGLGLVGWKRRHSNR